MITISSDIDRSLLVGSNIDQSLIILGSIFGSTIDQSLVKDGSTFDQLIKGGSHFDQSLPSDDETVLSLGSDDVSGELFPVILMHHVRLHDQNHGVYFSEDFSNRRSMTRSVSDVYAGMIILVVGMLDVALVLRTDPGHGPSTSRLHCGQSPGDLVINLVFQD